MTRIPRGLRYMAAGAFFFSVMSLFVKAAGTRLPTMEVVLARSVVVLLICAVVLRRAGVPLGGRRKRLLLVRGLLGFVALSSFYYGIIHLPLADATVIQYTNPVFTGLLAALLLGEGLRRRETALTLASLGGVVVMVRPAFLFGGEGGLPPIPAAVALVGAVFSAAAYVAVRRLGRSEEPLVIVLWFAGVSTVGALPFVWRSFVIPTLGEWLVLAAVGVSTHLGQLFLTKGLREERAGKAMGVAYLQIVFAAIWGLLFFAEVPDRGTVAGAAIIVGATWLLARSGGPPTPAS